MENKTSGAALKNAAGILMCPLCRGNVSFSDGCIKCAKGHSFDVSRGCYVNFLSKPVKTGYGKKLFASRRAVTLDGFFDAAANAVSEIISKRFAGLENISIVDFGCGEGSLFKKIISFAGIKTETAAAVGADISKDGASYAAGMYKDVSWIVADLAAPPLKDESADIILNVLAPANYAQFRRCAKKGALIIKVVPEAGYLKEIRAAIGKPEYFDENAKRLFNENFNSIRCYRVCLRAAVKESLQKDFLQMTPLAWGTQKEGIDLSGGLTIDLSVLCAVV
jgi:23S rRNA (guanine745-N1)-methyltransferase